MLRRRGGAPNGDLAADWRARSRRAIGAHSEASDQRTPRREAMPLMRTVERPTSVSSCGKDWSTLTGEFGESSLVSKPPGSVSTEPSKSQIAVAAGPSRGEPSRSRTPSSRARREISSSCASSSSSPSPPPAPRAARATITLASVVDARAPICLTWPKSMSPTRPSSSTKMLPGCGSAWKKPPSRMVRPNASVRALSSFRPKSCASGESGSMPRASIASTARESGSPRQ
mmetsp:Transcript_14230/g.47108  ORF Transcript_14230/g.47108 Transcript_14230/m.47108 type:complete len:229 (-) Transcript_14230:17-703(-)